LVDFCVLPILADLGNCRFSQNQLELSQPNRAKLFKHQPLGSCHFLSLSLSVSVSLPTYKKGERGGRRKRKRPRSGPMNRSIIPKSSPLPQKKKGVLSSLAIGRRRRSR
jgi:hypothetical protein